MNNIYLQRKRIGFLFGALVLLGFTLFFITLQHQQKRLAADFDFAPIFRDKGNFFVIANGVGTRGDPATGAWSGAGDFVLDIPDSATIVMARAIWTGRSAAFDADGVELSVDGGAPTVLSADFQYEESPWCCMSGQLHESAIVTSLIEPGLHTYTIADHEHGTSPTTNELNYGVGIWVVYEYTPDGISKDLERETVVYQGQDSFFRLWSPTRGPHTEVRCATFDPSPVQREVEMVHLVSGVDTWDQSTGTTRLRSVAVWSESGTGPLPPEDEVDFASGFLTPTLALRQPDAQGFDPGGQYPLQSYAGLEWDNFDMSGLIVPANHEWLCFQIESGDHADLAGLGGVGYWASGMWNLFALSIYDPSLSIELVDFAAAAVSDDTVLLTWVTASETNNFGFNIYRSTVNDFSTSAKVHFEPASADASGASYQYFDTGLSSSTSYYYWLEDVNTSSGDKTLYGPLSVTMARSEQIFLPLIKNR